jgi:hypothetical protein
MPPDFDGAPKAPSTTAPAASTGSPPAAMARTALSMAVVAAIALPIDVMSTIVDAFRDWAPPSECCPGTHPKPVWLAILQGSVPFVACCGIGFAIAVLADEHLRRRPANWRRAVTAVIVGALTAAAALWFR